MNASVDGLGAFAKTAGRTGVLAPRGGQLRWIEGEGEIELEI